MSAMAKSISREFRLNLQKLIRQPCYELTTLMPHWNGICKKIQSEREQLYRRLRLGAPDDPILFRDSLLTPMNAELNERLHTQALAYLFDTKTHEFEAEVLTAFLNAMPRGSGTTKILPLLKGDRTTITVEAEYRFANDYIDLWIEIRGRSRYALVVIENKIGAPETRDQLKRYEKKARDWCNRHSHAPYLIVYLTPQGKTASSGQWVSFSYLQLASILRKIWDGNRTACGRTWLGMYIAAITRGVLEIDPERLHDSLNDLKTYLGESV
ncbi:MAG: PD-(D/E)XK nuclease family protein [Beijerinckiaceae bacterium]|jgi:hypothetical protein